MFVKKNWFDKKYYPNTGFTNRFNPINIFEYNE